MAASRNDQFVLSSDTGFQNRVKQSLVAYASAVMTEPNTSLAFALFVERHKLGQNILNGPNSYASLFASAVASDASVISDATQAGTVALTGANVAAQGALVTDAHLDAAVIAAFSNFTIAS